MIFVLAGWGLTLVAWAVGNYLAYQRGFRDGRSFGVTQREFQTLTQGHGLPRTRR